MEMRVKAPDPSWNTDRNRRHTISVACSNCLRCGKEIPEEVDFCYNCRTEQDEKIRIDG